MAAPRRRTIEYASRMACGRLLKSCAIPRQLPEGRQLLGLVELRLDLALVSVMSRTIGMTPSSSPWCPNSAESVTASPVGRACAVAGDGSNWRIGCPAANCCLASRYSLAGRTSVFQLSLAVRLTRVLYFPRQTSFNVCRKACSLYSPSETVPSWPWAATFSQRGLCPLASSREFTQFRPKTLA